MASAANDPKKATVQSIQELLKPVDVDSFNLLSSVNAIAELPQAVESETPIYAALLKEKLG
jgi:hypothetical protein